MFTSVTTRYLPLLTDVPHPCRNSCYMYVTVCLPGYLLTYLPLLPRYRVVLYFVFLSVVVNTGTEPGGTSGLRTV